uniref:Uncharacterized protein n=1 Tax=Oryza glaberrima TaxID=4538 RepID=I1NXE8_ORYGL
MLLDDTNPSNGSSPDSELCERLSCSRPVRLPRDGEICPSRALEASKISAILMSALQVMPSHVQQFVPFRHDAERPPSPERPARNWRRTLFSWSMQESVEEAKQSTVSRANPSKSVGNLLLLLLHGKWKGLMLLADRVASQWSSQRISGQGHQEFRIKR